MGGGASGASAVVVRSVSGVAAVVGRWWVGSAVHIFITFVGGSLD